ncbi:MAG: hypothetical protein KGV43_02385 [Arcobacter sp.]|nr:hypothetical protein [Arcobacter sp.]
MEREEKERLKKLIRADNFIQNNGKVLGIINILRYKFTKLSAIKSVFATRNIGLDELLDSVNFLYEAGYIILREIDSKEKATLADTDYDLLEAKLSEKGIRLCGGGITDNMIEV